MNGVVQGERLADEKTQPCPPNCAARADGIVSTCPATVSIPRVLASLAIATTMDYGAGCQEIAAEAAVDFDGTGGEFRCDGEPIPVRSGRAQKIPCSQRHMNSASVPMCAVPLGKFKPKGQVSMRLLRTSASSMRPNSPSASEAADKFNENFAGCCRSRFRQAARRSIACSMTH